MPRLFLPVLTPVIVAALLLGACAREVPTRSGFLDSYDSFKARPSRNGAEVLVNWTESAAWEAFDAVHVAPVTLRLGASVPDGLKRREDREAFEARATASLEAALDDEFELLAARTDGALEVRAAITGVDLSDPALNVMSAALLLLPMDTGGATVEMQVADGDTGAVLHRRVAAMNGAPHWFRGAMRETGQADHALERIFADLAADLAARADRTVETVDAR